MSFLKDFISASSMRSGSPAHFVLRYQPGQQPPLPIGHLEFDGTRWLFRYDEAYKGRQDLRPLEGFESLDKVYVSQFLFPFFAVRLPDRDRPDIQRAITESKVRQPNVVDLLRLFGRKAASSPGFELVAIT
jgi:HipA-like protein